MSSNEPRSVELFISYAHEDDRLRQELTKHLASLRRQGVIREWHDREIHPGAKWDKEIDEHLKSAQIILLLVSPDFMASDYCNDVEVRQALDRHERGEAVVIPVVLRPVDWEGAPFRNLQALPKDARPVVSWPNRDQAMTEVAQGIRKVAERLTSGEATSREELPTAHEGTPTTRQRWELVLDADLEEMDKERLDAIIERLRQLTGDKNLSLRDIKKGSVRLIVEYAVEEGTTIGELFNSGLLAEIEGVTVKSVRRVREEQAAPAREGEVGGVTPRRPAGKDAAVTRQPSAKAAKKPKSQVQKSGADSPEDAAVGVLPIRVLREAIRAVPAVKYALGVAGVAAAVAIVAGFSVSYKVAVLGTVIMFVLMFVLVIFASFVRTSKSSLKPLSLTLAWAFVILIVATSVLIFTEFFFEWPRPLEQTAAKLTGAEPAATPASSPSSTPAPAQAARTLHYSIMVCKPHTDPDCRSPFTLAGEINFEARYKIRLNVSSPQPGFLYVINEGPQTAGGLPEYVMLFPTVRVNDGSAGLDADKVITFPSDSWLRLDAEEGKEKLWLVWSSGRVGELETAARTVAARSQQDKGAVTVPGDIVAVRDTLRRYAAATPKVTKSEELGRTIIEAQADTLAYPVVLEHH